jgi:hypothetical protein
MRVRAGNRFHFDPIAWMLLVAGFGAVAWLALSV